MRNPYLEGNFAPVRQEHTVTDLPVTGSIPDHLDGRYLRNGPNPIGDPNPATYHWFTGTGMLHGIRIRDGRAEWYRNRWVRSAEVARHLGAQPRPGPVNAGFDYAANSNVISQGGRTFALIEAHDRTNSPTNSTPSDRATSTAPCPAGTPLTRTATRTPASCTRCRTTTGGATACSTPCSARTPGSGARWTSR